MIVRARAPLRLGLAGGGTDVAPYSNRFGGYVMNATIDKYAYAILDRGAGAEVELAALDRGVSLTVPPGAPASALPPELRLHGRAAARFAELSATAVHISLTHSDATAVAVVIVER